MWDFSVGRAIGALIVTFPFTLFRLAVYCGVALVYLVAIGGGTGIGWGVGHIFGTDGPATGAVWGGIAGLTLSGVFFYWVREWFLYMVKAGHVAVLVHVLEGRPVPGGQGQVAYAAAEVKERFLEANALFVVDQLVRGVVAALVGLLNTVNAILPIPGLGPLVAFVDRVLRIALGLVDEMVIAHVIRTRAEDPWAGAREGLVLYAQNHRVIVVNAIWLAVMSWLFAGAVFLIMLAPASAIAFLFPSAWGGWTVAAAALFAWAVKAAVVEPFAVACLMQVYFRATAGQRPDPAWDARLDQASAKFRELKARAGGMFSGSRA